MFAQREHADNGRRCGFGIYWSVYERNQRGPREPPRSRAQSTSVLGMEDGHDLAKAVTSVAFASLALAVLFVFAAITTDTYLDLATYGALFARLLAGSVPFFAFGLAIAFLMSPNAAAVTGVVWIALSFASGLFLPPPGQLPDWVRTIAWRGER